jgi:RNA-directed DNA polymerase
MRNRGGHVVEGEQFPDKLNLYSINDLEFRLHVSREELGSVAAIAGACYRPFKQAKKPRPFQKIIKPPKLRDIDNPTDRMKRIQRRINDRLLKPLALPSYLCGGVRGKSVIDNVNMHLGSRCLVTIDIKSFFPSIDNHQVFKVWRNLLNCSDRISRLLTRLTTFERHLPQGAPTSTLLANLVLHTADGPIRDECKRLVVRYSSWVDDLAFSGDNPQQVIQTAASTLRAAGFAISHKKLKIMGPGTRKCLNGTMLTRFPSVHPERLGWIRSGIHKLRTGHVPAEETASYVRSLKGKIQQVLTLAPRKGIKLLQALENASPRPAAPTKTT